MFWFQGACGHKDMCRDVDSRKTVYKYVIVLRRLSLG